MSSAGWLSKLRALLVPGRVKQAAYEPDLVAFETPFAVSAAVLSQLDAARALAGAQLDVVEQRLNGFVLDPGLGPPVYLAGDGRIVWDGWYEWHKHAPTERDAYAALVFGAKKTGVTALLELLPARPGCANDCLECKGTGWRDLRSVSGEPFQIICPACGGLGWLESSGSGEA